MHMLNRRVAGMALIGAALGLMHTAPAHAQAWPSRPVTMVVPFTAGTTSDVIARSLAQELHQKLGQPFIIENKGGAGGNIGATAVARANADGYTILFATTGQAATNQLMYKKMEYSPQRDFASVVLVAKAPVIITAKPDAPFSTLKDFIAYAKANPGKATGGFPGNGTLGHITGELLARNAGIDFVKSQYRGSAQILTDLIGNHIDVGMDSLAGYVPSVRENKIKALAIASSQRWSRLPDVPTVAESLPGFEAGVWYAILVPAKTPDDVVTKINAATNAWLKDAKTQEFLANLGIQPAGGTPADLKAFTQAEIDKWGPIIKDAKIEF
ncbi:tripartite tricarboxylate transporter substrate binding protein [Pseudolabrys sp. FHR47]|uniref:Bug family tripartite tricarboxylate transporter substrate binding protein n=1 Tax=Pseudolabrys sp. FHR47 TaxID=2562284 RepID=UPI0010BE39EB|nr:tripartite tricarboxylate transporter substrate binding protein [Pseudolabrys sp. FHR47]